MATRYTMEDDFYRDRLAASGIARQHSFPDLDDRGELQRIISDELCLGVISPSSHDTLIGIARQLVERGSQGFVLGCTELELSVTDDDLLITVFATTSLHCQAALDRALADDSH